MSYSHLKIKCIGCERKGVKFNQEHVFPRWLILKTGTDKTGIKWFGGKNIPALSCTIPLCKQCNDLFGQKLEVPVSKIFNKLESDKGINDHECEILTRWLWKLEGIFWHIGNSQGKKYTGIYTLSQRVLNPIDQIRGRLVLAVSRFNEDKKTHKDLPMGVDSRNELSAIFVSGVFSKLAMLVTLDDFIDFIPNNFTCYKLKNKLDMSDKDIVLAPKIGFKNGIDAIKTTIDCSITLSRLHDQFGTMLKFMVANKQI